MLVSAAVRTIFALVSFAPRGHERAHFYFANHLHTNRYYWFIRRSLPPCATSVLFRVLNSLGSFHGCVQGYMCMLRMWKMVQADDSTSFRLSYPWWLPISTSSSKCKEQQNLQGLLCEAQQDQESRWSHAQKTFPGHQGDHSTQEEGQTQPGGRLGQSLSICANLRPIGAPGRNCWECLWWPRLQYEWYEIGFLHVFYVFSWLKLKKEWKYEIWEWGGWGRKSNDPSAHPPKGKDIQKIKSWGMIEV